MPSLSTGAQLTSSDPYPCRHAIYIGTDPALKAQDDQWILEPIQKGGPTVRALIAHIEAGSVSNLSRRRRAAMYLTDTHVLRSRPSAPDSPLRTQSLCSSTAVVRRDRLVRPTCPSLAY